MAHVASQPVAEFLRLLRGVVENGDGKWKAYCPVHENDGGTHDPSLGILDGDDGKVVLKCLACDATVAQIVHAAGSTMSKLFPSRERANGKYKKPNGKKIATYEYRNEVGNLIFRAERFEPKHFSQSQPNGQGGVVRVPYRLPELIAAPKPSLVFVAEGEKKVEALREWGLIATCNVGGAGKWQKAYSKYLAGHDVIILPDNDPLNPDTGKSPGIEHARQVMKFSEEFVKSIRILELPGLPLKGDIVDWKQAGGTLPQLMELVNKIQSSTSLTVLNEPASVTKSEIQEMDPLDLRVRESRSDKGNAKRFILNHEGNLKFCYPWKKWLRWDGRRWEVDQNGSVFRNAKAVSEKMWDDIATFRRDVSEETLKQALAFAMFSGSNRAICNMVHLAESEDGHQFMPSELDSNPWLFNCPNGTIDLRTGELKPHEKSDLITQMSPVEFDPDAKCPVWESFLQKIFGSQEMVDYVQRLVGCWSSGIVKDETLPILWGIGSNGKTTFVNAIMGILGPDYSMKAATDFLMIKKFQGHPTEKADLFRKRFVICSETDESGRLDESMVKDLTGQEKIRARRMREDNWEFDPTHHIALMTNHLPQIRGTDHGIWRRIRKIEFGKQFWNPDIGETGPPDLMRDNTLKDKILEEYPGILTWVVRGAIVWNLDGELAPKSVSNWTNEYRASQDVLKAFIDEWCVQGINQWISVGELYAGFSKWGKAANEFVVKKTKFGILMTERGFQRDEKGRFYMGIDLNEWAKAELSKKNTF